MIMDDLWIMIMDDLWILINYDDGLDYDFILNWGSMEYDFYWTLAIPEVFSRIDLAAMNVSFFPH